MIFIDASALVSLIANEPDAAILASRLKADPERAVSAMSVWETVAALCRSYRFSGRVARTFTTDLLDRLGVGMVTIGAKETELALDAYETYGRGRHPAGLNMGDCFAYACAKANGAALLYKGDDFARTDLAWPRPARS